MSHPGALSRYVESRVRKLADNLSYLPLCRIRLLPKKLPLLTVGGHEGVSYLVGFDVDRERLRGDELHMTNQVEAFREEVSKGASVRPRRIHPIRVSFEDRGFNAAAEG